MAIFKIFSKRQKELRGETPNVYTYDELPHALKVQIILLWEDVLGHYNDDIYEMVSETFCREHGLLQLPIGKIKMHPNTLANYLLQTNNVEKQLDIVELSFKYINEVDLFESYSNASDTTNELNMRFKEHGIGFQFVEGEIIKVDSELIHSESVQPALRLLNEQNYQGAQQEFLGAYKHYNHGKNKEALNECLKSFESTMKAICDKRKWPYQSNATAKKLIQICFDNELVPKFWQQQLRSLSSILESSIPTGRNKLSAHGQGATPTIVPDYLVAYMLHMTASTLLFLTTAEKQLP